MSIESVKVFNQSADSYDGWFDSHSAVFQSELDALKKVIPNSGEGLEVGVGSGRFSAALGIKTGIEPAVNLSTIARARGITVYEGVAESLPFQNQQFDFVLFNTVLCFLDLPLTALSEAKRVLKPNGTLIIGMIDKNSMLGKLYEATKQENPFYQHAHLYSVKEVLELLHEINFKEEGIYQTLFSPIETIAMPEEPKSGYGEGGFVVLSAHIETNRFLY
ncbi:class I SAM-dependent methyltransferase [Legionella quateirensis]|uniref:Demethylmenaquinone methyltransferase n=1 Tax=Legionella quateirensis TaxID=45072 RepID=A0A378PEW2_9GAMM|nr:class I SAM-dependent methyltransferase [Legionella quateirensis]KTD53886.1 Demethylmenaquinone methyltransferase [Legionella quateirensis]STY83063.1 type 11 methyltransferase [Legionella quateirensis]